MKVLKVDQIKKELQVKPLFTGSVTQQTVIDANLSNRFAIRQVNFDKGVRDKFHTHSSEQILIITEGKGKVATDVVNRHRFLNGYETSSVKAHFYRLPTQMFA